MTMQLVDMKKRILVVDDDLGILDVLNEILCEFEYDVRTINRGEKVFDAIADYNPDLILMDVMLSGMDGRNICKVIKSQDQFKNIPIIMISANVSAYNIMFDVGAPNDFIAKPFDMANLIERIETQLTAA